MQYSSQFQTMTCIPKRLFFEHLWHRNQRMVVHMKPKVWRSAHAKESFQCFLNAWRI